MTTTEQEKAHPEAGLKAPVLELRAISKSFGPVLALRGVDLVVMPGEVHAVVGENGAGKSTLISIAGGILSATSGSISIDGKTIAPSNSMDMRELGITVASQHPMLAPDLTVYENLQLISPTISRRQAEELVGRIAGEGIGIDLGARVETLDLALRHVVEIASALASKPRVLVLDEPTEPFHEEGVRQLFRLIASLRQDGVGIIYISHRLNEVMEIADRISVLRDGSLIETGPTAGFTMDDVVTRIAGRPLDEVFPPKRQSSLSEMPVLVVRGLGGQGFSGIDLAVRPGEIIGLTGVEGQGQREFIRALAGLDQHDSGTIEIAGTALAGPGPAEARRAGVGFVSNDRHTEGLFLPLNIRENISLGISGVVSRHGIVDRRGERTTTGDIARRFGVKAPSVESQISALSGGNQQKVLIGREMAAEPRILLIDEPTHGVDIGARSEIYFQIRAAADQGMAVVVNASDGIELEGLSDRILVFSRGTVVRELVGGDVNDTNITEANLAATGQRGRRASAGRSWIGAWLASDYMPTVVLAVLTAALMFGTDLYNPRFLAPFNFSILMTFVSALALVSIGQLALMMLGEIDLSVGPLMGLVVVLASFQMTDGQTPGELLSGAAIILICCAILGLLHGLLSQWLGLPAVVITLATFSGLQGLSLLLRPSPGGLISEAISAVTGQLLLGLPACILATIALVICFEVALRRTYYGRLLRASGSAPFAALRHGLSIRRTRLLAFVLCSVMTGLGGLVLAGQVGIGTASTGVNYTLLSITAAVLSGAKISGGRGSFVSVFLAATLVQTISVATPFLQISDAWQYWLVGAITLLAAGLFRAVFMTSGPEAGTRGA